MEKIQKINANTKISKKDLLSPNAIQNLYIDSVPFD